MKDKEDREWLLMGSHLWTHRSSLLSFNNRRIPQSRAGSLVVISWCGNERFQIYFPRNSYLLVPIFGQDNGFLLKLLENSLTGKFRPAWALDRALAIVSWIHLTPRKGNVGSSLTGGRTQRMIRQFTVNLPLVFSLCFWMINKQEIINSASRS